MTKTTRELYNKRFYDEKVGGYPADGFDMPLPIDMWYGPQVLFGRVDQQYNVVQVSNQTKKRRMSLIRADARGTLPVPILDFVAKAFSGLQDNFRRAAVTGRLNKNSVILDLKPKSGFVDPDILYETHSDAMFSAFTDVYLGNVERSRKVLDFDSYLKMFFNFVKVYGNQMPITRTLFLKTAACSPLVSGLIIELASEDFNDDDARQKWINDPNFEFYVRTSRKFGFRLDEHAPWRLIANLASPAMQKYWWHQRLIGPSKEEEVITKIEEVLGIGCVDQNVANNIKVIAGLPYGAGAAYNEEGEIQIDIPDSSKPLFEKYLMPVTIKGLFSTYFVRSCISDIDEMVSGLISNYNNFVDQNPSVKMVDFIRCAQTGRNKKRQKTVYREEISASLVKEKYDIKYWLKMYLHIRFMEENLNISKTKSKRLLKSTYSVLKRLDKDSAIMYINEAVQGFPKKIPVIPSRQLLDYLGLDITGQAGDQTTQTQASQGTGMTGMDSAPPPGGPTGY